LIGLTSLWISGRPAVSGEFNRRRAVFVLGKIDEILSWERTKEKEKDARFLELGEYLCEVRAKQFWRLENLKSFDEFLEERFPDSRRKTHYLMAIHENLIKVPKQQFRAVGWSKAVETVKVARKDGDGFDCATWLHKANELPKEGFKGEVERHLTGKETEAWEIIYFKLYESQFPVVEKALETAGLMLGTDKSRGYCLEMICADFWQEQIWKERIQGLWYFRCAMSTSNYHMSSKICSCMRLRARRVQIDAKTTSDSIGSRGVQGPLQAGSQQRQLALPALWRIREPTGSSYPGSKSPRE
jgi:hypothetical protein